VSFVTLTTRPRPYERSVRMRKTYANDGPTAAQRDEIIMALAERGVSFEELAEQAKQPDADPFDLLCHLAFNAPLRTRCERAQRVRQDRKDFFDRYRPEARQILDELLEKYAQHGDAQFVLPDVLHVPPAFRTRKSNRDHSPVRRTRKAARCCDRFARTTLWLVIRNPTAARLRSRRPRRLAA
jgi:hypothetical protein